MSSYNDLSDNVNESFDFKLRGKQYEMRYPRTEELEAIQKLGQKVNKLSQDSEEFKVENEKLTDAIYEFISPVDHNTKIKDALKKENIKVLQNFNTMIKTELAV